MFNHTCHNLNIDINLLHTLSKLLALPVNQYLDAVIIIQLSIKLPLLAAWHTSFACPKQVSRKRHPTIPALRAPLRCSPVAGRQKLADAQTGLASCSTTGSAAQRHRMGNSTLAHTCPGTRYPDDPIFFHLFYSFWVFISLSRALFIAPFRLFRSLLPASGAFTSDTYFLL